MRRHIVPWSCVAGAALVAACSGGSAHPATLPVAHTAAPTALTAASTTTSSVSSTSSTTHTTTIRTTSVPVSRPVAGDVHLSADGPWTLVASAPGITTPGLEYELMPRLWVYLPTKEDIPNGIIWTLRAPDVPIIEAYLHARLVYFQAITANPIDVSSPDWQKWYADGGTSMRKAMKPAIDGGWSVDLAMGVVLRPEVIGDGRDGSNAVVFDCALDGSVYRLPSGEIAPGSTAGIGKQGFASRLVRHSSQWKVAQVGVQPEACV